MFLPQLITLLLIVGYSYIASSQTPFPAYLVLKPQEYKLPNSEVGPQNLGIVQDELGRMIFCNNYSLLSFDGNYWKAINGSENRGLRCLLKTKNHIFSGGNNDLGVINSNSDCELHFQSLIDKVPISNRKFGMIWDVEFWQGLVFFRASETLLIYNLTTKTFQIEKYDFRLKNIVATSNSLWVNTFTGKSIFFEKNKKTPSIISTPFTYRNELPIWIKKNLKEPLLTEPWFFKDSNQNCYVLTQKLDLISIPNKVGSEIFDNIHKKTLISKNGEIAIVTHNGGVYIFSKEGKHRFTLNKHNILPDNAINSAYLDYNNGLWLTTDKGVVRISMESPLSFFNEKESFGGIVSDISKADNNLYLCSSDGVYWADNIVDNYPNIQFKVCTDLQFQSFHFVHCQNQLLACTGFGVFKVNGPKTTKLFPSLCPTAVWDSARSSLFMLKETGLFVSQKKDDVWSTESKLCNLKFIAQFSIIDSNGKIWASDYSGNVACIDIDNSSKVKLNYYTTSNGLFNGSNKPFKWQNDLIWSNSKGLLSFDKTTNMFLKSTKIEFENENTSFFLLKTDRKGRFWIGESGKFGYLKVGSAGKYSIDYSPTQSLPQSDSWALFSDETCLWASTNEGLIRYDYSYETTQHQKPTAIINKVQLPSSEKTLFEGAFIGKNKDTRSTEIAYSDNAIEISFASTFYENLNQNKYSYLLHGAKDKWSEWLEEPKIRFPNLGSGQYVFQLKTKNVYGIESEITEYAFTILPPWYNNWLAYLFYTIGFVGIVYTAVKINARRLQIANLQLENIVAERTEEIREQRDTIGQKNKDITDSIVYASKIQQAVLPEKEKINSYLPENFIFYKPKDIVSGDFYWFTKLNYNEEELIFIAAVDCTGHGVPGAFMSMMGIELLNKIVLENNVVMPNSILNSLNNNILEMLKHSHDGHKSLDGMDIALCQINRSKNKLYFSSANRPLQICNGTSSQSIKGDNLSIGGHTNADQEFKLTCIDLITNDTFYLYSDGFSDQFGGKDGKKFMQKNLRMLLSEISTLPMPEQMATLEASLNDWKGLSEQVDDILVIGFRV